MATYAKLLVAFAVMALLASVSIYFFAETNMIKNFGKGLGVDLEEEAETFAVGVVEKIVNEGKEVRVASQVERRFYKHVIWKSLSVGGVFFADDEIRNESSDKVSLEIFKTLKLNLLPHSRLVVRRVLGCRSNSGRKGLVLLVQEGGVEFKTPGILRESGILSATQIPRKIQIQQKHLVCFGYDPDPKKSATQKSAKDLVSHVPIEVNQLEVELIQ